MNLQEPLRNVTTRKLQANGKERDGAFKASQDALKGNTPEFAFFRPYTPDLLGWFDDFSHPLALFGDLQGKGIFPNFDCKASGGEVAPSEGNPGCRVAGNLTLGGKLQGTFPHLEAGNYGAGK